MKEINAKVRGAIFTYWNRIFRANIEIGHNLKIFKRLFISGNGRLEIGNNCVIQGIKGDKSQFVCIDLRSKDSVISIGNNVSLLAARIAAKFEIIIGDESVIDESAVIDTDFHTIDRSREDSNNESYERCKVTIGKRVYIGPRSVVMKGVTIGDGVVVMPGSVVVNSIKPGLIICGNPAKPIAN